MSLDENYEYCKHLIKYADLAFSKITPTIATQKNSPEKLKQAKTAF